MNGVTVVREEEKSESLEAPLDEGCPPRKVRRSRWGLGAEPNAASIDAKEAQIRQTSDGLIDTSETVPMKVFPLSIDIHSATVAAREALEKAKKARELQLQAHLAALTSSGININFDSNLTRMTSAGAEAAARLSLQMKEQKLMVPHSLRFDSLGRHLDDEGRMIGAKPTLHSTLKINKSIKRQERLRETFYSSKPDRNLTDPSKNKWFDGSLRATGAKSRKLSLRFIEPGFFQKKEEQMLQRAYVEELKRKLKDNEATAQSSAFTKFDNFRNSFQSIEAWAQRQSSRAGDEEEGSGKELAEGEMAEGEDAVADIGEGGTGEDDASSEFNPNMIPIGGGLDEDKRDTDRFDGLLDRESSNRLFQGGDSSVRGSKLLSSTNNAVTGSGRVMLAKKCGERIPEVEWWDVPLLRTASATLVDIDKGGDEQTANHTSDVFDTSPSHDAPQLYGPFTAVDITPSKSFPYDILFEKVTHLVEHPLIETTDFDGISMPPMMHLTPAERSKLRRRKKQEKEREMQDKVRMGLIPPPPPKTKLSNLMRVLGEQAVANPSKTEAKVRKDMAKRLEDHRARNEARRLAPEERSKKKSAKWQNAGPVNEYTVLLFKVKSLTNRKFLFKVDRNAQQLHLTGSAVLCPGIPAVVVTEGSKRASKKFMRLMCHRIGWQQEEEGEEEAGGDAQTYDDDDEAEEEVDKKNEKFCKLIWTGVVKEKSFKNWKVFATRVESEARKLFVDKRVEYYWDMANNYQFT